MDTPPISGDKDVERLNHMTKFQCALEQMCANVIYQLAHACAGKQRTQQHWDEKMWEDSNK